MKKTIDDKISELKIVYEKSKDSLGEFIAIQDKKIILNRKTKISKLLTLVWVFFLSFFY